MGSPIRFPVGNDTPGSNQNPGSRSNSVSGGYPHPLGNGEQSEEEEFSLLDLNSEQSREASSRIDETALTILAHREAVVHFFVYGTGDVPGFSDIGFICGGNTTRQECQAAAVQL